MARNRRRARDRRRADRASVTASGKGSESPNPLESPNNPLEHAAPDAEIAAAQLALGRPDAAEVPDEESLVAYEEEQAGREAEAGPVVERRARRESMPVRFAGFLRGCWRELQRVQWPDRRQVMQATGVVLGFVIVAGVFLGVADLVSSSLMKLIL